MHNKKWHLTPEVSKKNATAVNMIKDWNPAYADHMFDQNRILEAFAMSPLGGVDFFSQPVCKECFKPGTQIHDKTFADTEAIHCYCERHGITHDTKTVREYLVEDLHIPPMVLLEIELKYYAEGAEK